MAVDKCTASRYREAVACTEFCVPTILLWTRKIILGSKCSVISASQLRFYGPENNFVRDVYSQQRGATGLNQLSCQGLREDYYNCQMSLISARKVLCLCSLYVRVIDITNIKF